jgi:hypothetical protein
MNFQSKQQSFGGLIQQRFGFAPRLSHKIKRFYIYIALFFLSKESKTDFKTEKGFKTIGTLVRFKLENVYVVNLFSRSGPFQIHAKSGSETVARVVFIIAQDCTEAGTPIRNKQ